MAEAVRFSEKLDVRCPPEIAALIDRAAARKCQKTSEWVRQALVFALRADGLCPADSQQFALATPDGEIITTGFERHLGPDPRGTWLPIVNEDSEPFDPKIHWRGKPEPLRVDGDRVVRRFPIIVKSLEAL